MFNLLRRDLQRYYSLDSSNGNPGVFEKLRIIIDAPGLQAVAVYRFGSWLNRVVHASLLRLPLKFVYYLLDKLCIIFWGIHIDEHAEIGGGLYIGHFSGVLIGPVRMGCDCNVAHQVTIGRRADGAGGVPTIGDRVWIGVGSVLFGNIHVGDGVTIGPNSVVSRNLPSRVMVMGYPLRVLRRDHDNTATIYGRAPDVRPPPDATE